MVAPEAEGRFMTGVLVDGETVLRELVLGAGEGSKVGSEVVVLDSEDG